MNFKSILYSAAILALCVACKKNSTETAPTPTLNGTLKIDGLEEFVSPGQKITLKPSGITHPNGETVRYYWKVTPGMTKNDTTDVFEYTFSDTLRTHTVYCTAYASGYSSSSIVAYSTTVKGGKDGSLKGIDALQTPIDGTEYYQTVIGTQTWLQNNVYEATSGTPYRNSSLMSDILGKYYNYEDAKAVCESIDNGNWKLPSREDWETLEAYIKQQNSESYGKTVASAMMVNATFNDATMWEYWPSVGIIKNGSGLSVIPSGYVTLGVKNNSTETDYSSGKFEGVYNYATFWTSTQTEDGSKAYYKYLYLDQPNMLTGVGDKLSFGASVRCIKK